MNKKKKEREEKRENCIVKKENSINHKSVFWITTSYLFIGNQFLSPKHSKLHFDFNTTSICYIQLCRIQVAPTSTRSNTPQSNTTFYKTLDYNF